MKTQEDFVKEILELKTKNPEMEIKFCVDSEDVLESGWTYHEIYNVEICPWFNDGEEILTDENEIREHFDSEITDVRLSDEEVKKLIDEKYEKEVKDVICVFTEAG